MTRITKRDICYIVLKYVGILACSAAFIIEMIVAWQRYEEEATVTGITSFKKSDTKYLPCITFCPYNVFKNAVYPMTIAEFEKYSYQETEIFADRTLKSFNKTDDWKITKVTGPLVGTCFMTQYLKPVKEFELEIWYALKRTVDLQLYIHNPGKNKNKNKKHKRDKT